MYQLGVLATGFILVAIQGNSPYFPRYQGATSVSCLYLWLAICGVGYGILGGIFGRLLAKGIAGLSPEKWRGWVRQHPYLYCFIIGFSACRTVGVEMTGAQLVLIWLLISSIIASIISRQFSPKPFYHFAAGRFRQQMQARQAEELRSKTKQEK